MEKLKALDLVDLTSYIAIINATVFMLLFEFSGGWFTLSVALLSYMIAFLTLSIFSIIKLVNSKNMEQSSENNLTKKQKFWLIIKTIFSIFLFVFCIIIFINC